MKRSTQAGTLLVAILSACKKPEPPPMYEAVPVVRRDIMVSAQASGAIEPILVVDVKSRASGTILQMRAETGQRVRQGDTLVSVDRRDPTNTYNQAEADLEVARAQLTNAESQKRRTDAMFQTQLVSEQDHEAANLTYANARAQQVRAQTALQTARDALDDCNVLAPVTGTIIAKNVEVGNVIASATHDVSGGVVLLRMADLSLVQVRTLVDETDIGKISPGLPVVITVDAFPNRPFQGTVLKVEPQSTVNQNVTMFPVLIRIANEDELLKPGMNAEVQVMVDQKPGVLAIPNAALRTQRDVGSAAQVLGLDPAQVLQTLAHADSQASKSGPGQHGDRSQVAAAPQTEGSMGGRTAPATSPMGGRTGGRPEGPGSGGPAGRGGPGGPGAGQRSGGQHAQGGNAMASAPGGTGGGAPGGMGGMSGRPGGTGMSGGSGGMGGGGMGGGGGQGGGGRGYRAGGAYIVFVLRDGHPAPLRIRTGATDMDYSEVTSGLTDRDTVLLLPSASLLASQKDMKDRFTRMTGGGVPGMKQQAPATPGAGGGGGGGGGRPGGGRP